MDTSSWLNRTFESIGSLGSFGSFSQGDERQRGSDVHEHEDLECDMDVDDDGDDDVESQYSTLKRHPSSNHIEHSCGRESEMKHTRTLSYTNQESEWDRLYRSQELEMEEKSPVKLDEKLTLMDYIWKEKVFY